MAYLLLIMEPRDQRRGRSAEEGQLAYAQMVRFGEGLEACCKPVNRCAPMPKARG